MPMSILYRLNPFSQGVVRQDGLLLTQHWALWCLNPFSQGVVRQDAQHPEGGMFGLGLNPFSQGVVRQDYAGGMINFSAPVLIPLVRAWSDRMQPLKWVRWRFKS